MPRPDPALLNPARYPFRCTIEPRFSDLDVNMHINNVAMVEILQEARVRFHHISAFHEAIAGFSAMVASLSIEYLGQAYYTEALTAHIAVSDMGRTSYGLALLIRQQERTVAYAQVVLVCMGADGPVELSAACRECFQPYQMQS